jgi:hypothetical protein
MFHLSLQAANELYGVSHALLIIGALLVFAGTVGVFWTGDLRDRYAAERISNNEAETAIATAEAAKASERAAELTRQAASLQVDLERERIERLKIEERIAPRRLTERQRDLLQKALAKIPQPLRINGTKLGDKEAATYADDMLGIEPTC